MNLKTRRFGPAASLSILFIAFFLAASPGGAAAEGNYFLVKGGVYSPQSSDVDNLNEGVDVEVALGKFIMPMVALELSGGYFEASKGGSDLTVYPLTLAGKVRLPLPIVKPYGIAGVGAYFAELDLPGEGSDKDTAFGYFLGAGIDFKILVVLVNIEAKYLWAQPSFRGVDTDIDGVVATLGVGLEF